MEWTLLPLGVARFFGGSMFSRRFALFSAGMCAVTLPVMFGLGRFSPAEVPPPDAIAHQRASQPTDLTSEASPFSLPAESSALMPLSCVAAVTPDRAALIAEEIALAALAEEVGLALTGSQLTRLAEITSCYGAIRHTYEAKIARVTPVSERHFRLEIPAYPVAGEALRKALYDEVLAQFGPATGRTVVDKLGTRWAKDFAAFGHAEQTLDIVERQDGVGRDYTINRTVITFGGAGDSRPLTRRETYIPSIEDATGEQWGPFLAVLPADVSVVAGN